MSISKFGMDQSEDGVKFMLSSMAHLYKDKEMAVIRELTCNAIDAHIESSQAKPIDIHLSNSMFFIRDYGKGISKDFMENGYTQAFRSTKRDDDKTTGGFGVGRLSFSTITNNAVLTSIHDGVKTIYNLINNGDGDLALQTISSEDSDEESGFEIRFLIDTNSKYRGLASAIRSFVEFSIFQNFNFLDFNPFTSYGYEKPIEPLISKGEGLYYKKDFDGFTAIASKSQTSSSDLNIVMGNILYKISGVENPFYNESLKLFFFVEPSTFRPTPSREDIVTDDTVIQKISSYIQDVKNDLMERYNKVINKASTTYELLSMIEEEGIDIVAGLKGSNKALKDNYFASSCSLGFENKFMVRIEDKIISDYKDRENPEKLSRDYSFYKSDNKIRHGTLSFTKHSLENHKHLIYETGKKTRLKDMCGVSNLIKYTSVKNDTKVVREYLVEKLGVKQENILDYKEARELLNIHTYEWGGRASICKLDGIYKSENDFYQINSRYTIYRHMVFFVRNKDGNLSTKQRKRIAVINMWSSIFSVMKIPISCNKSQVKNISTIAMSEDDFFDKYCHGLINEDRFYDVVHRLAMIYAKLEDRADNKKAKLKLASSDIFETMKTLNINVGKLDNVSEYDYSDKLSMFNGVSTYMFDEIAKSKGFEPSPQIKIEKIPYHHIDIVNKFLKLAHEGKLFETCHEED